MLEFLLIVGQPLGLAIAMFLQMRAWINRQSRKRRETSRLPPVLFRGTAEQAEQAAAWRAVMTGRPVVPWWVNDDAYELRDFARRPEAEAE